MARRDIRVRKQDADTIRVGVPFNHLDLTIEEAGELTQQLLGTLGCSFEIQWPDLKPTMDEQIAARTYALARRRERAEDYARSKGMLPSDQYYNDVVHAFIAGHDDSPKPLNHPYR